MNDLDFTKLVNQYSKLLFTVCYRFTKDYQEAENLTQETFLTAYRAIGNFVGDNYKPWLVKIATNKCKDYLKSSYVKTTSAVEDEFLVTIEDKQSVQAEAESADGVTRIKEAIERLPSPYDEVAKLYYIEEKTFEELAVIFDKPIKTVQTQVYRARDKLRLELKETKEEKCYA